MGGKSRPYRDSIPDRPDRSSVAIPIELPDPLGTQQEDIFLLFYDLRTSQQVSVFGLTAFDVVNRKEMISTFVPCSILASSKFYLFTN